MAKFSRTRRRAATRSTRRMLERIADFIEPTLLETPPDPFRAGRATCCGSRGSAARSAARRRRGRGGGDPHRRGARRSSTAGSSRSAQGDARDRRDHRRVGVAVDARHRLRAVPPRDGRGRRRARRLGLRPRRDGRRSPRRSPAPRARTGRRSARARAVVRILVRDGGAEGVVLEDGTELFARRVASNADATRHAARARRRATCPRVRRTGRGGSTTRAAR